MALFWSKTEILGQSRVFLFCRLAPEIRALRAKIIIFNGRVDSVDRGGSMSMNACVRKGSG